MKWDAALETGIPIVDEQHQSLFRQVEDLLDASKADRVKETLAFLSDYVVMHFRTEELMQKASKYPGTAAHKKLHDDFVVAIGNLKSEYGASDDGMLILMKITKTAINWLNIHIRGADREFADFFRASGIDGSKVAAYVPATPR